MEFSTDHGNVVTDHGNVVKDSRFNGPFRHYFLYLDESSCKNGPRKTGHQLMQTNLLWTGREYYSLENCLVNTTGKGTAINSVIVGKYNSTIYRVEYEIHTNKDWQVVSFALRGLHSDQSLHWKFASDGNGNWTREGKPADEFKGCIDIDIPLTPFTNTLPINRLALKPGSSQRIRVLYLDVLEQRISRVEQQYTRLSDSEYQYENVPNDFEAKITVDASGFVVDYPQLFVRTAAQNSHYSLSV